MKRLLLTGLLFALPTTARADDVCDQLGLYALALNGCPQYRPGTDTSIPLCEQPGLEDLAYLDERCYREVPFDFSKPCFAWNCPVPYDRVFVEPISGRTKTKHATAQEIDWNYRAARASLGQALKGKR